MIKKSEFCRKSGSCGILEERNIKINIKERKYGREKRRCSSRTSSTGCS